MAKVRVGGTGFLRAAIKSAEGEIKRAMERGIADAAAKVRKDAAQMQPRGRVEFFVGDEAGNFHSLDAREAYDIDLNATEVVDETPALPPPGGERDDE